MRKNKPLLRAIKTSTLSLALAIIAVAQQPAPPAGNLQIGGTLVGAYGGQPLAHARVAIAPANKRQELTTVFTREDGVFSFTGLAPGTYVLTGQARGYIAQLFNQHDQFTSSIIVGPELDTSHLIFRLPREAAIAGVVVDEAGEPVREAQVALFLDRPPAGIEGTRSRGRSITNDQGVFHFSHLMSGRYIVAVNARPWYAQQARDAAGSTPDPITAALDVAYPLTFYGGTTDPETAAVITLASGDQATIEIALQPVRAVRIPLNQESAGVRPEYLGLQARGLDGAPLALMTEYRTDNKGHSEIVGVAPGRYTLQTVGNAKPGADNGIAVASEIVINSNGEVDKTQSALFVPVTARLQSEDGVQPAQTYLQLQNKRTRERISERANENGEIVFGHGVLPGTYEVWLFNAPGVYLKNLTAEGARLTGRTLEIRSGSPVKLNLTAARGQGQVTGTAVRDGKPVMGAMVLLVPADPGHNQILFRRDQSNSDGSFQMFSVVPGAYTLVAIENGWDLAWTDAAVLKKYLSHGVAIQLKVNAKEESKVEVQ